MPDLAPRETINATVPTISCASCVLRINALLRQQRGVSGVRIDLPTKTIQFAYRPEQITLDAIRTLLAEAGYPLHPHTIEVSG